MEDRPDLHRLRSYSKQATSTPNVKSTDRTVSFTTTVDDDIMTKEGKIQKGGDAPSRAKVGGFGALGARMRSLSSSNKKGSPSNDAQKDTTPQIPSSQSKVSLAEEAKKAKRSSSFFHTFSGSSSKKKSSVEFPSSPGESAGKQEVNMGKTPSRRPRLSMPGLSPHLGRTPSQSPFELTASPQPTETAGSPGEFNLKGFRNVRRQSSYFSYNVPEDPKRHAGTSSPPRSSATQYALTSSEDVSRLGASTSVTPRLEDLYQSSGATTPFYESKPNSPTPEGTRSISAGKFRQAAASNRRMDDALGDASKTTSVGSIRSSLIFSETLAKHGRPGSPFLNLNSNSVEMSAALESDKATSSSIVPSQGSDEGHRSSIQNSEVQSAKAPSLTKLSESGHTPDQDVVEKEEEEDGQVHAATSSIEPSDEHSIEELPPPGDEVESDAIADLAAVSGKSRKAANRISMLPWLHNDTDGRRASIASATSSLDETTAHSNELMETLDSSSDLHGSSAYGHVPTMDGPGAASLLGHAMITSSAFSTTDHEMSAMRPAINSREREPALVEIDQSRSTSSHTHESTSRKRPDEEETLLSTDKAHRRISSVPLDFLFKSQSTPSLHHQLSSETLVQSSSFASSLQSRAQELLSFHDKQAPSLLAAQNRSQFRPSFPNRIAWPTPACVKAEYFAKLPAIHQHSLYEQHCKAADHAVAEYLRLMAGVVPPEVMIQPEVIFPTFSTHDRNQARSRTASLNAVNSSSEHPGRRRGSAGNALNGFPVPPLPSHEDLEKMEARARHADLNGYSQFRRKSETVITPGSKAFSNSFPPDDRQWRMTGRQPSARFMMSQYQSKAPLEAFGVKRNTVAISRSKTTER